MSDYVKATNFTAKDSLSSGDSAKIVRGSEIDTELTAISVAIATKYDSGDIASQGAAEAGTNNTTLMTPLRVNQQIDIFCAQVAAANVFTATGAGASSAIMLQAATPTLTWDEQDASVDEGVWDIVPISGQLRFRALTDAFSPANWCLVTRSGNTVIEIQFDADALDFNAATADFSTALTVGGTGVVLESRTITGGSGIAAMGDLSANRTVAIDWTELTALTTVDGTNDLVAVYDDSASSHKKVAVDDFIGDSTQIGYRHVPQNLKAVDYTLALADRGKHIYHTSGTPHTFTIPANADIALPVGSAVTFVTGGSSGDVTIHPDTGVTLRLAGTGDTGDRTQSTDSVVTIIKVATNTWVMTGVGVA